MSSGAGSVPSDKFDPYVILNVSRECTESEITAAFKKLRYLYHPDKHTDTAVKEIAQRKFTQLQEAYAILSDSERRMRYDLFGEVATPSSNMQVAVPSKSVEAMKREWERARAQQRIRELEAKINVRTELRATLNVEQVLFGAKRQGGTARRNENLMFPGLNVGRKRSRSEHRTAESRFVAQEIVNRLALIKLTQIAVTQSFQQQIGASTFLEFAGTAVSLNRNQAIGRAEVTLRTTLGDSLSILELVAGASSVPQLSSLVCRVSRQISPFVWAQIGIQRPFYLSKSASMSFVARTQLSEKSVGQLQYDLGGDNPGVSMSYSKTVVHKHSHDQLDAEEQGKKNKFDYDDDFDASTIPQEPKASTFSGRLHFGLASLASFSSSWNHQLGDLQRTHGKVTVRADTLNTEEMTGIGFGLETSLSRAFGEHNRCGIGLNIGLINGISLTLRFDRGGQKIVLPVVIASLFDWKSALASYAIVGSVIAVLQFGFWKPGDAAKRKREAEEKKKEQTEWVSREKERASMEQQIIKNVVARKLAEEEAKNGLVVVNAKFGLLDEEDSVEGQDRVADVTLAMQALVDENSRIVVSASVPKGRLDGFWDPAPDRPLRDKSLRIVYRFQGHLHAVDIRDGEAILLPQQSHRVD
eukprot:ANDGO_02012.mRNA.1 Chaperone protein dnaJ 13